MFDLFLFPLQDYVLVVVREILYRRSMRARPAAASFSVDINSTADRARSLRFGPHQERIRDSKAENLPNQDVRKITVGGGHDAEIGRAPLQLAKAGKATPEVRI